MFVLSVNVYIHVYIDYKYTYAHILTIIRDIYIYSVRQD